MTFIEIWNQSVRKKPALADGSARVEFTSDNLYLLLEQVYEQGKKAATKTAPSFKDIFKDLNAR